jgi:hypothetical protein
MMVREASIAHLCVISSTRWSAAMSEALPAKAWMKSSSCIRSIVKKLRTRRCRNPSWRRYAITFAYGS